MRNTICIISILVIITVFIPFSNTNAGTGEKKEGQVNENQPQKPLSSILLNPYYDTAGVFTSTAKSGFIPLQNPNEKPAWQLALATNPLSLFLFNQIAVSLDVILYKRCYQAFVENGPGSRF
jgi:hypothetical protein